MPMTSAADKKAANTRQMGTQRVWATEAAVEAIVHLHAKLGNLILRHVAGAEGAPEVRPVGSSIPRGHDDICLGTVGGVLFLIDREHDIALGCPDFIVEAKPTVPGSHDGGSKAHCRLTSRAVPRG